MKIHIDEYRKRFIRHLTDICPLCEQDAESYFEPAGLDPDEDDYIDLSIFFTPEEAAIETAEFIRSEVAEDADTRGYE